MGCARLGGGRRIGKSDPLAAKVAAPAVGGHRDRGREADHRNRGSNPPAPRLAGERRQGAAGRDARARRSHHHAPEPLRDRLAARNSLVRRSMFSHRLDPGGDRDATAPCTSSRSFACATDNQSAPTPSAAPAKAVQARNHPVPQALHRARDLRDPTSRPRWLPRLPWLAAPRHIVAIPAAAPAPVSPDTALDNYRNALAGLSQSLER
jgi:hypothetical protein